MKLIDIILKEGIYVDLKDQAEPGVKDSHEANYIDISIKTKPQDQFIYNPGKRKINNYTVFHSFEPKPGIERLQDVQDAIKKHSELMYRPVLEQAMNAISTNLEFSYIACLGSSEKLSNKLASVAADKWNVPKENVLFIPKLQYVDADAMLDRVSFDNLTDKSHIKKKILDYIEKAKEYIEQGTGWEIKKSKTTGSDVIQRLHTKYNIGKHPTVDIKSPPKIYEAILNCLKNRQKLLIVDDNVHTGTDFAKLFKIIDTFPEIVTEKVEEEKEHLKVIVDELEKVIKEGDRFVKYGKGTKQEKSKVISRLRETSRELALFKKSFLAVLDGLSRFKSNPKQLVYGYVLYKYEKEN